MGPRLPIYVGQNFGSCAMYSDLIDEHIWYLTTEVRKPQESFDGVELRFDVATGKADRWPFHNYYYYIQTHPRRHMACGISYHTEHLERDHPYYIEIFDIEGGIRWVSNNQDNCK